MKKTRLNIIYSLWVLLIILNFQGCSLIGFGVGRAVDRNKAPSKYLHSSYVSEFKKGMKIKVINKKGFIYKGVYHGLDTIPMTYDTLVSVMMITGDRYMKVYLHDIEYINVPENAKKWKWIGLGIGLAIDVALIRSGWEPPQWIQDVGGEFIFGLLSGG